MAGVDTLIDPAIPKSVESACHRLQIVVESFGHEGYAVLDGGHFDDLPAAFRRDGLFARSLFLDQAEFDIQRAGPWLVKLHQAPETTGKVMAFVGNKPAAVFWRCGSGEATLHRHLRTLNMAKIPVWAAEGREAPHEPLAADAYTSVFFRHYDPRVLGALLPCLDAAQFSRFLGPAAEVGFVAMDFGGLKRVIADPAFPAAPAGLLTIYPGQIQALVGRRLASSRRNIVAYLREVAPEHTRNNSDDELLHQVEYSEAVGGHFGLRTERAHAQWAFLMTISKGHVANETKVVDFICAPGHSPDRRVDEAMKHVVAAARERDGLV